MHGLSHAPDTVDEGTTLPPEETNEAEGRADKMQPVGFEVTVTDKSSQTLESRISMRKKKSKKSKCRFDFCNLGFDHFLVNDHSVA